LAFFFVYPIVTIVGRGLWPDGHLDLDPIGDVLGASDLRGVLWFTAWQAAVSTLLTLLAALPAAYVVTRYRFRGRMVVRALMTVPFVLPTVVVASAFRALGFEQSIVAILIAHVFFNYAVVVRAVGGLWSHLDPHQEDAARVLGATRIRAFTTVTLPALRPAIMAAASIVYLFSFTSFGVILILGGSRRATLETEIYLRYSQLDLGLAAALAVVQLVAVVALLVVTGRLQGRRAVAMKLTPAAETARPIRHRADRAVVIGVLSSAGVLLGTPIAVLIARSLDTAQGFGFGYYRALGTLRRGSVLFVAPVDAIANSLLYALVATVIALLVGGVAAFTVARSRRGGVLDTALALPLGVSAVTLGLGFMIAFDPPIDLRTSWVLTPVAHALVAIPFVVFIAVPVIRSIDPRLREAATVLGASPRAVWREVDLPVAARGLMVGAGFAFAISLGEFGATAFIARPDHPTLPVVVFRLLGQPGAQNFGAAMAASTILMVLTLGAVLGIERLRAGELGTF
jgi:thiamine transport system permease protein